MKKGSLLLESLPLVLKVQTKSNHEGAVFSDRPFVSERTRLMDIDFYYVDSAYVNFLKQTEMNARGFTCVPNTLYSNRQKFLYGAVLTVNGLHFYVPVSSKVGKNTQYNLPIIAEKDKVNKVKGSLRFPYMIPVPPFCLSRLVIKNLGNGNERSLLSKELAFCRKYRARIQTYAKDTYIAVTTKANPKLVQNSCDFALLENAYLRYCQMHNVSVPLADRKQILLRNGLGSTKQTLSDYFNKDEIKYTEVTPDEARLLSGQPDLLCVIRKGKQSLLLQHLAVDEAVVMRVKEKAKIAALS